MIHKIDFFTYTNNLWGKKETPGELPLKVLPAILRQHLPDYMPQSQEEWIPAPKKKYFLAGLYFNKHSGFWINRTGLICVEHTGMGCTYLEQAGLMLGLVSDKAEHCTRIDIATDIYCDTDPIDFITSRDSKSAKSYRIEKTSSGLTYNLGSKTSERFVKVYRYNEGHPREKFLRVEYTYRNEDARIVCRMLKNGTTIEDIAVLSGKRYKWTHKSYEPHKPASNEEIRAWRPERKGGKTLFWLHTQVIPAIRKEVEAGHIDLEEFIADLRKKVEGR